MEANIKNLTKCSVEMKYIVEVTPKQAEDGNVSMECINVASGRCFKLKL